MVGARGGAPADEAGRTNRRRPGAPTGVYGTNLARNGRVTPRVNLADLIARRVPLMPREAATLTLAVAREWDRQRALHGPIALPHIGAIELTDHGSIVFLLLPPVTSDDD